MIIKRYPKIHVLGHRLLTYLFDDIVEISEKTDGCFTFESLITLANGTKKKIGEIVNNELPLDVLTFDETSRRIETKKIVKWYKKNTNDDWIRIILSPNGFHGQAPHIKCTSNHRLLREDYKWVEAKNLKENDSLLRLEKVPNLIQKQVLLGTLLGDSWVGKGYFSCAHSLKQKELIFVLKNVLSDVKFYITYPTSGYGSKMIRIRTSSSQIIRRVEEICSIDYKKTINSKWMREITPISLAWWYMDDGSFSNSSDQRGYVILHTQGYSHKEIELLCQMLHRKYSFDPGIKCYKGYEQINLNTKDSELFLTLIAPYVLPSLQYKLPPHLRFKYNFWDYFKNEGTEIGLVPSIIEKIDYGFIPPNKTQYDIGIEDNHNYFVNNILVHNSQFRIYLNREDSFEVGTKNTEGLEIFKSRIEMTKSDNKHDMFDLAVEQAEKLKPKLEEFIEITEVESITLYTEYLRSKHHNGLIYNRIPSNNLYLFGATYLRDDEIYNMETSDLIKLANKLNIEPPNILCEGMIDNQEDLKQFLKTESILGGTKVEGIVIKNYKKSYLLDLLSTKRYVGFPLAGKLVRDEFKEIQRGEGSKQKKANSIDGIAETYLTEQRFLKCLQHLNEEGKIINEKKDLAVLIPEVLNDLLSEEKENIDKIVLNKFYEDFRRRLSNFVVKQYNEFLLNRQFENE